jgi:two-component system sensor histidine kinase/response regulator
MYLQARQIQPIVIGRTLLKILLRALDFSQETWADGRPRGAGAGEKTVAVGSSGRRVLLAEDNLVNQTLAVRLLEKRGYHVTVAPDGLAAVTAARGERFDVVLMDIQMPEKDGFEATARIREEESASGRRIPIIAMTAHALKGDLERCLAAGMDRYISEADSHE